MTLSDYIKNNISDAFAATPVTEGLITLERLLRGAPDGLFAIMTAVPYPRAKSGRIASFAGICDYHAFFSSFEEEVSRLLSEKYGDVYVKVFSDHSPIDERRAAVTAGLGVIGDNGLFISEKYGSFVFLGEIICSLTEEQLMREGIPVAEGERKECLHCGLCAAACPAGCIGGDKSLCVSALTQKKGVLSDTERDIIKSGRSAWGCDICALVCPMNDVEEPAYRDYFTRNIFAPESFADVDALSDDEYGSYPFSWRKKEVIRRNFDILDNAKEDKND